MPIICYVTSLCEKLGLPKNYSLGEEISMELKITVVCSMHFLVAVAKSQTRTTSKQIALLIRGFTILLNDCTRSKVVAVTQYSSNHRCASFTNKLFDKHCDRPGGLDPKNVSIFFGGAYSCF